jgi:hypothetical protein
MGEGFVKPAVGSAPATLRNVANNNKILAVIEFCQKWMKDSRMLAVTPKFDCVKDITFDILEDLIPVLTQKAN